MSSTDDDSGEMEALSEEKERINSDEKLATFKSRLELAKREQEIAEKEKNLAKAELESAEKEKNVFFAEDELERVSRQYKGEELKRRIKVLQKRLAKNGKAATVTSSSATADDDDVRRQRDDQLEREATLIARRRGEGRIFEERVAKKAKIRSGTAAAATVSSSPSAVVADTVNDNVHRRRDNIQEEMKTKPISRPGGGEKTIFTSNRALRRGNYENGGNKEGEIPLRVEDVHPLYTSTPKRGFGENKEKKQGRMVKRCAEIGNKKKARRCEICGKSFDRGDNLKRHSYIHGPMDQMPYKCHFCPYRSIRAKNVKSHMTSCHEAGAEAAVCPICQVVYSTKKRNNYVFHFNRYHR